MLRYLTAALVAAALLFFSAPVTAQPTGTVWTPCTTTPTALSATNASSRQALSGCGGTLLIMNTGGSTAYFKIGTASNLTAAATDNPIPANSWIAVTVPQQIGSATSAYVAAITGGTDTTTLSLIQGTGTPVFSASGAGSGGTVTVPGVSTAANQTSEIGLLTSIQSQAVTACNAAPVVSASAENSHILKATPGSLCGVYAVNLTATAGYLMVFNATSAPVDGAVTPLACVPLPASGFVSLNFGFGAQSTYSTGITAVVSSATTCFTKTTGVITGFIGGQVI